MMSFAVYEDNRVLNLIVSESKEQAELITGKSCIECDPVYGPHIGWILYNEEWVPSEPPYPSWVYSKENMMWEAPVEHPFVEPGSTDSYNWDEDSLSWILSQ